MNLFYLDRYHLDDPLFIRDMGFRMNQHLDRLAPCMVLHGSGEEAERFLEAEGVIPQRVDGVLTLENQAQSVLVERAVRQANQRIVRELTDAGVSAVSIQGTDRGLLRLEPDTGLAVGRVDWLHTLVHQTVVPVVSTLAFKQGQIREVAPQKVLMGMVEAMGSGERVRVVCFTGDQRPGLYEGAQRLTTISRTSMLERDDMLEPDLIATLAEANIEVCLSSMAGLTARAGEKATRVT